MRYSKCEAGEIWVKFESKDEYTKSRANFLERLIEDADRRLNTCRVKEYIKDGNLLRERFGLYSYGTLEALQDAFGADNVKFVSTGITRVADMEFTEAENIERIADALEKIAGILADVGKALERGSDPCGKHDDEGALR